jgi:hypothetical protein
MKLSYSEQAHIPDDKITQYLLNSEHSEGYGKAKFFMRFGFSIAQWQQLADALFTHAQTHEVIKIEQTQFGTRYIIEGKLETPCKRKPHVRVVWFIENGSTQPKLVTAYPLETQND